LEQEEEGRVFVPLRDDLSQGDVVADVPWGMITDPLIVCLPESGAWENKPRRKAFYSPLELTSDPPTALSPPFRLAVAVRRGPAMVMWEDCQIEQIKNRQMEKRKINSDEKVDPSKWFAAVAPLISEVGWPPDVQAGIARFEYHRYYPVPARPDIAAMAEGPFHVDLRYIWPVKQSLLVHRLASLSEVAREGLRRQLFLFLSQRRIIDPVICPSCGTRVPTTVSAAEPEADVGTT
jgi:hypothetical protein